jgi:hypothetical protein
LKPGEPSNHGKQPGVGYAEAITALPTPQTKPARVVVIYPCDNFNGVKVVCSSWFPMVA